MDVQDPTVEPEQFHKLPVDQDSLRKDALVQLEQELKTVLVKLDYEPNHDDHKRELRRILRNYARVFGIPVTGQD